MTTTDFILLCLNTTKESNQKEEKVALVILAFQEKCD